MKARPKAHKEETKEQLLLNAYKVDLEIPEIDKLLDEVKEKVKEVEAGAKGSKKEMKLLEKLHDKHKHLINKRKECVLAMR